MAVGFAADKTSIDTRAGSLAVQIRETFEDIGQFNTYLVGKTDAELIALDYVQADVALLRASFLALDALRLVAIGQRTVPAADNFLSNSSKLTGVN